MKPTRLDLLAMVLVMLAGACGGCATARMLKDARLAERRGEYIRAYELYRTAGKSSPQNGSVATGLNRVSSKAARAWHMRAQKAEWAGDYVRAWQRYMQALSCRPDARAPLDRIRTLERVNAEVRSARERFLREGVSTLVAAHAPPVRKPVRSNVAKAKPRTQTGSQKPSRHESPPGHSAEGSAAQTHD
ncbi:MAG: hypothetical protein ACE5GE_08900 [Phycisphaerae bacterium]